MKKHHSRIGLIASLAIHGALIGGSFALLNEQKIEKAAEQNSLSMEMVAALLEQPQVAVSPDPIEEVKEIEPEKVEPQPEPEPEPVPEPEAIPDPVLKPKKEEPKKEKPKEEKRKERPKEKKEKPKEEKRKEKEKPQQKPIKALERGPEVKQGIVAKAIPNAIQGEKWLLALQADKKVVREFNLYYRE